MSKMICIFGDSITRGAFDLERAGWASRLSMFLWEYNYNKTGIYYKGPDIDIFAVDGDIITEVLNRFDFEFKTIEKWGIANIFFAIGINDSGFENGEKRNNKKDFKISLERLIDKGLKKVGAKNIYFVGLTNIDSNIVGTKFTAKRIAEFDKIIQEVAIEKGCRFIPIQGLLGIKDLSDGLHPNSDGHKKMFERIKDFLIKNKII